MSRRPRKAVAIDREGNRYPLADTSYHDPLGYFLLTFNALETRLSMVIQDLTRPTAYNQTYLYILLGQVRSVDDRTRIFSQLSRYRFRTKAATKTVKSLVKRMRDLNSFRNDAIHGEWGGPSSSTTRKLSFAAHSTMVAAGRLRSIINIKRLQDRNDELRIKGVRVTRDVLLKKGNEAVELKNDLFKFEVFVSKRNMREHKKEAAARKA